MLTDWLDVLTDHDLVDTVRLWATVFGLGAAAAGGWLGVVKLVALRGPTKRTATAGAERAEAEADQAEAVAGMSAVGMLAKIDDLVRQRVATETRQMRVEIAELREDLDDLVSQVVDHNRQDERIWAELEHLDPGAAGRVGRPTPIQVQRMTKRTTGG